MRLIVFVAVLLTALLFTPQARHQQSYAQPSQPNRQASKYQANDQSANAPGQQSSGQVDVETETARQREQQERDTKEAAFKAEQLRQNRIIVWATVAIAVFGLLSFVAAGIYAFVSSRQLRAIKEQAQHAGAQVEILTAQAETLREQANAMSGQLDAMREQANIMRESLAQNQKQIEMSETLERGYMGIGDMTLSNLVIGGHPTVTIKWVNGGRTPVRNFRAMPIIVFGKEPVSNKIYFIDDDISPIRGSFFPIGAERELKYEMTDIIKAEEWEKFEHGQVQLFILGNFFYRDINGNKWVERISAIYDRFEEYVYETYEYADAEQSLKLVKPT